MKNDHISILGAGLIGSLLGIFLKRRGLNVSIYEKRDDFRLQPWTSAGRSINMALSDRGWKALNKIGMGEVIAPHTIPMYGRRVHDEHGKTRLFPYGRENQAIYAISRHSMNRLLADEAEKEGVVFNFNHKCEDVDINTSILRFSLPGNQMKMENGGLILGADGAYSTLRSTFQKQMRFNFKQQYISHGYKELIIPPNEAGEFAMDPNALHIWPRGKFMLIALPNMDKSFTCTLFLPFESGKVSFETIRDERDLVSMFKTYFNDAYQLMPNLTREFFQNPTSSLINIECYPWAFNKCLLIGDAAHAMVPFFGQGMNCGFEDCYELNELIEKYGTTSWDLIFGKFQKSRKKDTDAITQMAMDNFTEMRDSIANPKFLIRKKIDARLHKLYPDEWIPLYTMVTFSDLKYSEVYLQGQLQEQILDKIMEDPMIGQNWENLDFERIIHQADSARAF